MVTTASKGLTDKIMAIMRIYAPISQRDLASKLGYDNPKQQTKKWWQIWR